MLSIFILLAAVVNAAVLHINNGRDARPGSPVVRDLPVTSSSDPTTFSTATSSISSTTIAPVVQLAAETPCTPSSICFDGFTCGMRYGGCYDKNFCDGNTSPFPTPTCNMAPTINPTPTPIIISTGDRAVADDSDNDGDDDGDVMEEEQEDGSADAIVGPGTGN